jgi:2-oxo-4-hydroxy-4-carboxy-5-ureidoimidazoline decarboxylase
MTQISLDHLNRADKGAFVDSLGDIFEHSPWIAETAFARRPFASLVALYDAMADIVRSAGRDRQIGLVKSHPDLAGKAAPARSLTADSRSEQASAGLDRLSEDEFRSFHQLNEAYKAKFGIPFIICVRRHTKDSILRQFELRVKNDISAEQDAALREILRIAALRLDQRVTAPDRLKVHGQLSTHVLDTQTGRPGAGIAIQLVEIAKSGQATPVVEAVTNADGRTDKPLISERPVPIGSYKLRFGIGDYFARSKAKLADPPFLDVVSVRFSVAEPEGHYHVPLLATPWSYLTYRGS